MKRTYSHSLSYGENLNSNTPKQESICYQCKRELPNNWDIKICPVCEKIRYDAFLEGLYK